LKTKKLFVDSKKPLFIAGPCSAETEDQVLSIAKGLENSGVTIFRSGIWKPRTKPGGFEGIGEIGLKWLQQVKKETTLLTTCEVATAHHVELALKYGVDILWIGARTTVNPFSVQELADALRGVDVPIMVKNPLNPDIDLWVGAIERFKAVGIKNIAAIHRGFSSISKTEYRNTPIWEIPIELMRRMPELTFICDNSHICGNRELLSDIAQYAMDLNFDGLMTEVHNNPDHAWTDSAQQITPETYKSLIEALEIRSVQHHDIDTIRNLNRIRERIDHVDNQILELLEARMELSNEIGQFKKENNISILQPERWNIILQKALKKVDEGHLSENFIHQFLNAIHSESIKKQREIFYFKKNIE
jgi:chorismate mutase